MDGAVDLVQRSKAVIDTRALDAAVRRFPFMLREWRRIGRAALLARHVEAIRLEYRLVLWERRR